MFRLSKEEISIVTQNVKSQIYDCLSCHVGFFGLFDEVFIRHPNVGAGFL